MSTSNSEGLIDRLTMQLAKIPGVGKKSASRMAYFFLEGDPAYCQSLAQNLNILHSTIKRCPECGAWTETATCPICSDDTRDRSLICVVERPQDVHIIEESREFRGLFHVLGGLIAPLDGIGPEKLSIGKLVMRLHKGAKEVIIALNPTIEGDTTALYLQKVLSEEPGLEGLTISRLASGLPVGGDLEYTDRLTLSRSFRGRVSF
ncbi:MAG: recombination mediator RecR [Spirochaetaceae bacterium]|jgi:recombination protein RecR|nr:recombination mediator RecR [Spirochaetaceae bacterium]